MTKQRKLDPRNKRKFIDKGAEFITFGDGEQTEDTPPPSPKDRKDDNQGLGYIKL